MRSQKAVLPGLIQGPLQTGNGQGILGPDIDKAPFSAYGYRGNQHALYKSVGVPLQDTSVHKGPGISFITVAEHILLLSIRPGGKVPLHPCGKAGSSPAPETGLFQFADNGLRVPAFFQYSCQCSVAALPDGIFNIKGVYAAAVSKNDLLFYTVNPPVHKKGVNDPSVPEVLSRDQGKIRRRDSSVVNIIGLNIEYGAVGTGPHASCLINRDIKALLLQ